MRTINGKPLKEIFEALESDFKNDEIKVHKSTKKRYVPAETIEKRLNKVVGLENWNFYVSEPKIYKFGPNDYESCIISAKLVIYDDNRVPIVRSGGGAFDLIYSENNKSRPTSVGNAVDSAAKDVFKRCAKCFGIARLEQTEKKPEQSEPEQLMQVLVLEPFLALKNGGASAKVSYKNNTFILIIWKTPWEKLQEQYPNYFDIGKKINNIKFYGKESVFNGKQQLIFQKLCEAAG